jgi:hypothetical protein
MAIKFLNTVQVDTDVLYVDASINRVGINTATPIYDLDVDGAIRASGGFIDNTFTSDDTVRIVSPDNATYTVASGGETGAIKIQAPLAVLGGVTGTSTKVSFKVNTSDGVVIQFSGTFSRPGIGVIDIWTNISATIISDASNDANYTITSTGSGGGGIWIGSSTDSQAGLKSIWVTDCQVSGGNGGLFNGSPVSSAWDVSIDASVPTGFTASTYSNTQVTNWKRNGQDLYYGSGSGNVGIGTTSPNAKLEVAGSTRITGSVEVGYGNNNTNYIQIGNGRTTNGYAFIDLIGDATYTDYGFRIIRNNTGPNTSTELIHRGTGIFNFNATQAADITFKTNNAERIRINSSGNVGIGTTNPITSLTLGTGSSGISFQSSSTTLNSGKIAVIKQVEVGNGNGNLAFETYQGGGGGGERMRILNDGNVGIGTTSPDTKLEVSSLSGGVLRLTSTDTSVATGESIGRVEFKSNDASTGGNNVMGFVDCLATNAGSTYALTFGTGSAAAATEKMRINQSGNVGIGTTSPSELLHLSSTGPARLLIEADTDNITETDNAQIILKQDGGAVVGNLGYKTNTNSLEITNNYAAADGILTLGTSGIERMRIDYLGNVGIGTTSLTAISSSVATLSLGSTSASTSGGIAFQANGVVKAYNYVASNYLYSQTVGGIGQIFYIAGSERMRIHNTTGNVGIGTTSPRSKLQVEGVTGSVPALGAAASAAQIGGSTYGTLFSTLTSGTGVIQQGRSDGVTLTFPLLINPNGGNVGIGTTSPNSKLHVAGTVSHSTPLANFNGSVGSGVYGTVSVRVDNINYGTAMKFYRSSTADNNAIGFQNGASTVGSISIGTSSTSYNTTSDYRLKENLTAITDGIYRLKQLKPRRFNFIGNADVVDGFIAHEAKEVIPESVTGEKDEVLPNGDPVYQGIDQAKIVPLLTAALQEAISKIEQLETRIQTLENK